MTLGERIAYYRKKAGYSQEGLAERLGVSRQAISKWETGEATPDAERIIVLAAALGISTDTLLLGKEEPERPYTEAETVRQPAPPPGMPHALFCMERILPKPKRASSPTSRIPSPCAATIYPAI